MSRRVISPESILSAYTQGAFPMTDADGVTRWYTADPRGVLPLERFHIPKTLAAIVKQQRFDVRINTDFPTTMRHCMEGRDEGSWISEEIIAAYTDLHASGYAHSVECWQRDQMVGGLYGVSLGGAFFGESMFFRVTDASKVALVHLVKRLREREFALLDTQASTPHLHRFGCEEVPAGQYLHRLEAALRLDREFD